MLKANKVGLAMGCFLGLLNLVWALLVLMDLGQPLMDLCYSMHMIQSSVLVMPFDWASAITLVVTTAISGYVLGWVFAKVYTWTYK